MEGRGDGQQNAALGALGLGDLGAALDGGLRTRDDDLAIAVVIGGLTDVDPALTA